MLSDYALIKRQLYEICVNNINQRIAASKQSIAEAQQASANETKSSAGDKYETGRAMMQQEIDRNNVQLNEALKLKLAMDKVKPDAAPLSTINAGSLVITSNGNFYLTVSAGSVTLQGVIYHLISPASPIGLKLKGMQKNDCFLLNNKEYCITAIH